VATETFLIQIRQQGAAETTQAISTITKSSSEAAAALRLFRNALVVFSAVRAAAGLVEFADAALRLQNRLRVSTDSAQQFARAQQFISDVSRQTFTDIEANATVYGRFLRATSGLGFSQQQLEGAMTAVTEAIRIGGSTAEEASNGLIQLSQGMAAGALRGQDLRSVTELLPAVAKAIGAEFGVAAGGLQAFANANPGIITTARVINALNVALPGLVAEAEKLRPTLQNAFTVLSNSAIELIGNFNDATGAISALAQSIIFLADHLAGILTISIGLGEAWLSWKIASAIIGGITSAMAFLTGETLAEVTAVYLLNGGLAAMQVILDSLGIGLITAAIAALIFGLIELYQNFQIVRDAVRVVADAYLYAAGVASNIFVPTLRLIGEFIQFLITAFTPLFSVLSEFWGWLIKIAPSLGNADIYTRALALTFQTFGAVLATILFTTMVPFVAGIDAIAHALNALGLASDETTAKIDSDAGRFFNLINIFGVATKATDDMTDALKKVPEGTAAANLGMTEAQKQAASLAEYNKKVADAVAKKILQDQFNKDVMTQVNAIEGKVTATARAHGAAIDGVTKSHKSLDGVLGDTTGDMDKFNSATEGAANSVRGLNSALETDANDFATVHIGVKNVFFDFEQVQQSLGGYADAASLATGRTDSFHDAMLRVVQTLDASSTSTAVAAQGYDGLAQAMDTAASAASSASSAISSANAAVSNGGFGANGIGDAFAPSGGSLSLDSDGNIIWAGGIDPFTGAIGKGDTNLQLWQQNHPGGLPPGGNLLRDFGAGAVLQTIGGSGGSDIGSLLPLIQKWLAAAYTNPNIGSLQDFLHSLGIPGFAMGGEFDVPGVGSTDSQLVAFRATPGEHVSVTKSAEGGGQRPIQVIFNVQTPDANSFRQTQRQVIQNLSQAINSAQRQR
jgi:tape measure domain-containing protein